MLFLAMLEQMLEQMVFAHLWILKPGAKFRGRIRPESRHPRSQDLSFVYACISGRVAEGMAKRMERHPVPDHYVLFQPIAEALLKEVYSFPLALSRKVREQPIRRAKPIDKFPKIEFNKRRMKGNNPS
jgi:hypothetical protein